MVLTPQEHVAVTRSVVFRLSSRKTRALTSPLTRVSLQSPALVILLSTATLGALASHLLLRKLLRQMRKGSSGLSALRMNPEHPLTAMEYSGPSVASQERRQTACLTLLEKSRSRERIS